jgi:hypothetical protein
MLGDRQRRLIQVTLEAAAPYGAALGGRNALAVHGLSSQTAKQIDVVTSRDTVPEAGAAVQAALQRAGYQADRQPEAPELENTWPGGRDTAAEWHVRKPAPHDHPPIGGIRDYYCLKCHDRDYLGLSRAPRSRDPVQTDLGPVLHPEDAAGAKVADLARRGRIRDYAATADLLEHYSPAQLIRFARRLDPSLDRPDFARAAERLDQFPEIAFTAMRALEPEDVPRLRDRFASWPRDARQIETGADRPQRERSAPGRDRSEPTRRAPQPRQAVPARSEPSPSSQAPKQPDVDRVITRRRKREAERDGPELGQ